MRKYDLSVFANVANGEEGAKEVFARWIDCFASGQVLYLGEQK